MAENKNEQKKPSIRWCQVGNSVYAYVSGKGAVLAKDKREAITICKEQWPAEEYDVVEIVHRPKEGKSNGKGKDHAVTDTSGK